MSRHRSARGGAFDDDLEMAHGKYDDYEDDGYYEDVPAPEPGGPRRIDITDGKAYTKLEFFNCYGSLKEWEEAKPAKEEAKIEVLDLDKSHHVIFTDTFQAKLKKECRIDVKVPKKEEQIDKIKVRGLPGDLPLGKAAIEAEVKRAVEKAKEEELARQRAMKKKPAAVDEASAESLWPQLDSKRPTSVYFQLEKQKHENIHRNQKLLQEVMQRINTDALRNVHDDVKLQLPPLTNKNAIIELVGPFSKMEAAEEDFKKFLSRLGLLPHLSKCWTKASPTQAELQAKERKKKPDKKTEMEMKLKQERQLVCDNEAEERAAVDAEEEVERGKLASLEVPERADAKQRSIESRKKEAQARAAAAASRGVATEAGAPSQGRGRGRGVNGVHPALARNSPSSSSSSGPGTAPPPSATPPASAPAPFIPIPDLSNLPQPSPAPFIPIPDLSNLPKPDPAAAPIDFSVPPVIPEHLLKPIELIDGAQPVPVQAPALPVPPVHVDPAPPPTADAGHEVLPQRRRRK
eukprot:Sspe_Gene.4119::Locus_1360_Transcript_1_1_Confidence_1.000_Length_1845::g.4119::m.4119